MRQIPFAIITAALLFLESGSSAQSTTQRAVGPVTAAVRIDLFSDFECPSCKALHEHTIGRVKQEYARKGKLRLVHHDFPLPQHKHARRAAALAAAADRIGKFDVVADAIFKDQLSWSKGATTVDAVVDSVLTPDERKKIREIAQDPAIAAALDRDVQLGERMKVSSTPTMIVTHNGKPNPIVGAVSFQVFSKYLDSLLGPGGD